MRSQTCACARRECRCGQATQGTGTLLVLLYVMSRHGFLLGWPVYVMSCQHMRPARLSRLRRERSWASREGSRHPAEKRLHLLWLGWLRGELNTCLRWRGLWNIFAIAAECCMEPGCGGLGWSGAWKAWLTNSRGPPWAHERMAQEGR